jgi:hypothetical protein
MKNIKEIRFVATNYFNLQGLKNVAIGIFGILVAIWASGLKYPASTQSWIFLILLVVVSMMIYYGFDRYYLHNFGQVKRSPESKRMEWLVGIVSLVLIIGAFWLEYSLKLHFSLIGVAFGISLLIDYIRMTWLVKGRHLLYYPIGIVLIIALSLFPLFGLLEWWKYIGVKSELIGVVLFVGIFSIFAGIWGHIYLVRTLSSKAEEK